MQAGTAPEAPPAALFQGVAVAQLITGLGILPIALRHGAVGDIMWFAAPIAVDIAILFWIGARARPRRARVSSENALVNNALYLWLSLGLFFLPVWPIRPETFAVFGVLMYGSSVALYFAIARWLFQQLTARFDHFRKRRA